MPLEYLFVEEKEHEEKNNHNVIGHFTQHDNKCIEIATISANRGHTSQPVSIRKLMHIGILCGKFPVRLGYVVCCATQFILYALELMIVRVCMNMGVWSERIKVCIWTGNGRCEPVDSFLSPIWKCTNEFMIFNISHTRTGTLFVHTNPSIFVGGNQKFPSKIWLVLLLRFSFTLCSVKQMMVVVSVRDLRVFYEHFCVLMMAFELNIEKKCAAVAHKCIWMGKFGAIYVNRFIFLWTHFKVHFYFYFTRNGKKRLDPLKIRHRQLRIIGPYQCLCLCWNSCRSNKQNSRPSARICYLFSIKQSIWMPSAKIIISNWNKITN